MLGEKKKSFFLFIFFQNIFRDYRLCLNLPVHVYFIPLTFHLSAKNRLLLPVNLEMDFIIWLKISIDNLCSYQKCLRVPIPTSLTAFVVLILAILTGLR